MRPVSMSSVLASPPVLVPIPATRLPVATPIFTTFVAVAPSLLCPAIALRKLWLFVARGRCVLGMRRAISFIAGPLPFPAEEDRGDIAKLAPPDVTRAGVEFAPLSLFGFGQVVQTCLRLGGFFREECGIVARRLFYDSAQEPRVRFRLVGRPSRS
jgi:hypothetical protein